MTKQVLLLIKNKKVMIYILLGIVILGVIAAIINFFQHKNELKKFERGEIDKLYEPKEAEEECCGEHATCEKDSLLAAVSKDIEYYDDEELDKWKHIAENDFSEEAAEEFRHVFYTLQEVEVAGWVRSLHLREIEIPAQIKDEVLMIIRERRF